MKLLLASAIRYNTLLRLDPDEQVLEFIERKRLDESNWDRPSINGWFGMIDGLFGAIYVWKRTLFVKLNFHTVRIEQDITSQWERVHFGNRFALLRGDESIIDEEYARPPIQAPDLEGRDEESHDFWLYVHNMLSTPGKRDWVIKLWGGEAATDPSALS
ncbi:MAG TPA: hypothetical protein P5572_05520 [Phycisphaerae bacterium]|nr:hypothetical protein [Phycisphaerales bacterium]HRX84462.1 hypothetical protein [Phycisphaerae bacterium]